MHEGFDLGTEFHWFAPLVRYEQVIRGRFALVAPCWLNPCMERRGASFVFDSMFFQQANSGVGTGFKRLPGDVEIADLVVLLWGIACHPQSLDHCPPAAEPPFD